MPENVVSTTTLAAPARPDTPKTHGSLDADIIIKPAGLEQRIFDPFFTTKEVGAGTGLGLSITYGSIKEHQGTIVVENRPDEGALFLIQLPLEQ